MIIGCKTWLKPDVAIDEIIPPGYETYRHDRPGGYGGVLISVRSDMISQEVSNNFKSELVAAKIKLANDKSLIICSGYRPTNNDLQYAEFLCDEITVVVRSDSSATMSVGGDFNILDVRWSDHFVIGHRYRKAISTTSFLDMMTTVSIDQMANFQTRGDNTPDLFLTNSPSLVNRCEPAPGLSDHEIVFVEFDAQVTRAKPVRRRIHLWNKADVNDVRNSVQKFSDYFIRKHNVQTPVGILWEEIKDQHDQVMEQLVPSKINSTRFSQPWINTKVKRFARRKKRAYQKAKLSKCKKDWTRYKNLKKHCQANCRKTYNEFVNDMIANKSKKFWTFVKSKRNENTGVAPLKKNGITSTVTEKPRQRYLTKPNCFHR